MRELFTNRILKVQFQLKESSWRLQRNSYSLKDITHAEVQSHLQRVVGNLEDYLKKKKKNEMEKMMAIYYM